MIPSTETHLNQYYTDQQEGSDITCSVATFLLIDVILIKGVSIYFSNYAADYFEIDRSTLSREPKYVVLSRMIFEIFSRTVQVISHKNDI